MAAIFALIFAGLGLGGCESVPLDALTIDPGSLSRDLVAHWTFDATGGTNVADSSGNGYEGTLTGGTWISSGRFSGALSLASGDSVAVAGFPQAAASWTVSVWLRMSAAELAASTADFSMIISTELQYAGGWEIALDNRPSYQRFDASYFAGATVNDYVRTVCACIEADRWIHLTSVWDGAAEKLTLYRDAQAVDEVAMPSPIQTGNAALYMGKWTQSGRHLAADIDDFAIWRRALQGPEIAALSRNPPAP
ncbi:MAG: LamG domain-containing protein [Polyangia bacterium]